eukprot:tig00001038_g6541.t1
MGRPSNSPALLVALAAAVLLASCLPGVGALSDRLLPGIRSLPAGSGWNDLAQGNHSFCLGNFTTLAAAEGEPRPRVAMARRSS